MSVSAGPLGGGGRNASQDVDLNIAPLIDCITVLIAFLLASSSLLSVGLMDAGVAASSTEVNNDKPPSVNVELVLSSNKSMKVKISGKEARDISIDSTQNTWNSEALKTALRDIKQKWTDVNAITISADDDVEYKDIILSMDTSRKILPAVILGGFE